MSWNKPTNEQSNNRPNERSKNLTHGLLAGLIVVALGAAVLYFLFSGDRPHKVGDRPHAKPSTIATTTQVATSKVAKVEAPKKELSPAWQKFYDGRDTNKWIVVKDPVTGKERLNRKVKLGRVNQPPPLYKSHALNLIDAVAFKPALSPMLNPRIDESFLKSFQEGVIEKIEILPTDSEEIKERKQAMIELRKELVQRLKEGENIDTIVKDSIKERNSLATYRHQMQIEYARMKREGEDPGVVEAFGDKCNEILSEKGATPIMTQKRMKEVFEAKQQEK